MSDSIKKYHENTEEIQHTRYPGDIKVTIDSFSESTNYYAEDGTDLRDFKNAEKLLENMKRDKYIQAVKDKFEQRSQTGIKKYGTTLERDDLNSLDWLTHLEEELMDALGYIQVLRDKLQK